MASQAGLGSSKFSSANRGTEGIPSPKLHEDTQENHGFYHVLPKKIGDNHQFPAFFLVLSFFFQIFSIFKPHQRRPRFPGGLRSGPLGRVISAALGLSLPARTIGHLERKCWKP